MYRNTTTNHAREQVTVRHAYRADETALARLATLDSGRAPLGPALVAESDARILAALPLGSGRPIADPFEPTAELVALLELRRDQIERDQAAPRRSLAGRLRDLFSVAAPQGRVSS